MNIVCNLNDNQEKTLKNLKRLGYILNCEVNTKPGQVTLAMDILQYLMWEFSEAELIEIILKNKENERA